MDSNFNLKMAFFMIGILIIVGTLVMRTIEGWGYADAFYFTVMTITTIGYGDFVPLTDLGKVFISLFALLSIGFVLATISIGVTNYLESHHRRLARIETALKRRRVIKKRK